MRIPSWLKNHLYKEKFACLQCHAEFYEQGVVFLGVRNTHYNKPHLPPKDMLYMEYICPKCGQKGGYEPFEFKLEELSIAVLDDIPDLKPKDRAEKTQDKAKEPVEGIFSNGPAKQPETPEKPQAEAQKESKPNKQKVKSKISVDEKKLALNMLDESHNWGEWLDKIGAHFDEPKDEPKQDNFRLQNGEEE